jgi:hypothetical protein
MAHDPSLPPPTDGIGEKPPTAEEAHREYLARQDGTTPGEIGRSAVPIARAVSDADYDLAWDMAHASKEERYAAAEARAKAASDQAEYERRRGLGDGNGSWKKRSESGKKEAEQLDEDAERIEEWVQLIRDYPIPEEYMSRNNLTARGLAAIEKSASDLQDEIDDKLRELESSPLLGVNGFKIGFNLGKPVNLIAHAFGVARYEQGHEPLPNLAILRDCDLDEFNEYAEVAIEYYDADPEGVQKLKAYREALQNPETTLGQLRDMYAEAYIKEYIEPLRRKIESNEGILDSIRNGQFDTVS